MVNVTEFGKMPGDIVKQVEPELHGDPPLVVIEAWPGQWVVATARRVVVVKSAKTMLGWRPHTLVTYPLDRVTGILLDTGRMKGRLVVEAAGADPQGDPGSAPNAVKLGSQHFKSVHEKVPLLRRLVEEGRTAPQAGADPVSQLPKLKELLDAGVITTAEFEAKKAELLTRI